MEEDTLSEYPLQIQSTGIDLTSMMVSMAMTDDKEKTNDVSVTPVISNMFSRMSTNDLGALKEYIETNYKNIDMW